MTVIRELATAPRSIKELAWLLMWNVEAVRREVVELAERGRIRAIESGDAKSDPDDVLWMARQ